MKKEIILSPEELYYFGKFLQAKYIDYAYVAAMDDIGHNYSSFEKNTKDKLVSSGLMVEDFSGNLNIDDSLQKILNPIFFGEVEAAIDICYIEEKSYVSVNKLHFFDGSITMVTGKEGKLHIKTVDQIEIKEFISSLISKDYNGNNNELISINKEKVTRFVSAKNIFVGQTSIVKSYLEHDGILYQEKGTEIEGVTREQFITDVYDIVKGVQ